MLAIERDEARAARKVRELQETRRIDMARFRRRLREDPARIEERDRFVRLLIEQDRLGEALRELEALARLTEYDESLRRQIREIREQQRRAMRTLLDERITRTTATSPPRDLVQAWLARHPEDERARQRGGR